MFSVMYVLFEEPRLCCNRWQFGGDARICLTEIGVSANFLWVRGLPSSQALYKPTKVF